MRTSTPIKTTILNFIALIIIFITSAALPSNFKDKATDYIIQIKSPGTGSRLTSPVLLDVYYPCGVGGLAQISMTDANNDLLFRKVHYEDCSFDELIGITLPIYFDVTKENIESRISVSIKDQFDRPVALSSVDIRLVSTNPSLIPPLEIRPAFVLSTPQEGVVITGSSITVEGKMLPASDRAIILEIMTTAGKIIGISQIPVPQFNENEYLPFSAQILLKNITEKMNVRLIARQLGSLITVDTGLGSVEFFIQP